MQVLEVTPVAGRQWIGNAWKMFVVHPGSWIALLSAWAVLSLLLSLVPYVGREIVVMLQPAFFAGFVIAARDQERGLPVTLSCLFAGFRFNGRALLILGAVILLLRSLLLLLTGLVDFPDTPIGPNGLPDMLALFAQFDATLWVVFLGTMAVTTLIDGALWFTVPLLALYPMRPDHAIRWSFYAFLGNFLPLLVFALCMVGLVVIGSIPLGLGMIIVVPLYALAHYTSFRQVFRDDFTTPASN